MAYPLPRQKPGRKSGWLQAIFGDPQPPGSFWVTPRTDTGPHWGKGSGSGIERIPVPGWKQKEQARNPYAGMYPKSKPIRKPTFKPSRRDPAQNMYDFSGRTPPGLSRNPYDIQRGQKTPPRQDSQFFEDFGSPETQLDGGTHPDPRKPGGLTGNLTQYEKDLIEYGKQLANPRGDMVQPYEDHGGAPLKREMVQPYEDHGGAPIQPFPKSKPPRPEQAITLPEAQRGTPPRQDSQFFEDFGSPETQLDGGTHPQARRSFYNQSRRPAPGQTYDFSAGRQMVPPYEEHGGSPVYNEPKRDLPPEAEVLQPQQTEFFEDYGSPETRTSGGTHVDPNAATSGAAETRAFSGRFPRLPGTLTDYATDDNIPSFSRNNWQGFLDPAYWGGIRSVNTWWNQLTGGKPTQAGNWIDQNVTEPLMGVEKGQLSKDYANNPYWATAGDLAAETALLGGASAVSRVSRGLTNRGKGTKASEPIYKFQPKPKPEKKTRVSKPFSERRRQRTKSRSAGNLGVAVPDQYVKPPVTNSTAQIGPLTTPRRKPGFLENPDLNKIRAGLNRYRTKAEKDEFEGLDARIDQLLKENQVTQRKTQRYMVANPVTKTADVNRVIKAADDQLELGFGPLNEFGRGYVDTVKSGFGESLLKGYRDRAPHLVSTLKVISKDVRRKVNTPGISATEKARLEGRIADLEKGIKFIEDNVLGSAPARTAPVRKIPPSKPKIDLQSPGKGTKGYLKPLPPKPKTKPKIDLQSPGKGTKGYLKPLPPKPKIDLQSPGKGTKGYLKPLPPKSTSKSTPVKSDSVKVDELPSDDLWANSPPAQFDFGELRRFTNAEDKIDPSRVRTRADEVYESIRKRNRRYKGFAIRPSKGDYGRGAKLKDSSGEGPSMLKPLPKSIGDGRATGVPRSGSTELAKLESETTKRRTKVKKYRKRLDKINPTTKRRTQLTDAATKFTVAKGKDRLKKSKEWLQNERKKRAKDEAQYGPGQIDSGTVKKKVRKRPAFSKTGPGGVRFQLPHDVRRRTPQQNARADDAADKVFKHYVESGQRDRDYRAARIIQELEDIMARAPSGDPKAALNKLQAKNREQMARKQELWRKTPGFTPARVSYESVKLRNNQIKQERDLFLKAYGKSNLPQDPSLRDILRKFREGIEEIDIKYPALDNNTSSTPRKKVKKRKKKERWANDKKPKPSDLGAKRTPDNLKSGYGNTARPMNNAEMNEILMNFNPNKYKMTNALNKAIKRQKKPMFLPTISKNRQIMGLDGKPLPIRIKPGREKFWGADGGPKSYADFEWDARYNFDPNRWDKSKPRGKFQGKNIRQSHIDRIDNEITRIKEEANDINDRLEAAYKSEPLDTVAINELESIRSRLGAYYSWLNDWSNKGKSVLNNANQFDTRGRISRSANREMGNSIRKRVGPEAVKNFRHDQARSRMVRRDLSGIKFQRDLDSTKFDNTQEFGGYQPQGKGWDESDTWGAKADAQFFEDLFKDKQSKKADSDNPFDFPDEQEFFEQMFGFGKKKPGETQEEWAERGAKQRAQEAYDRRVNQTQSDIKKSGLTQGQEDYIDRVASGAANQKQADQWRANLTRKFKRNNKEGKPSSVGAAAKRSSGSPFVRNKGGLSKAEMNELNTYFRTPRDKNFSWDKKAGRYRDKKSGQDEPGPASLGAAATPPDMRFPRFGEKFDRIGDDYNYVSHKLNKINLAKGKEAARYKKRGKPRVVRTPELAKVQQRFPTVFEVDSERAKMLKDFYSPLPEDWDIKAHRYRDRKTGRFIKKR